MTPPTPPPPTTARIPSAAFALAAGVLLVLPGCFVTRAVGLGPDLPPPETAEQTYERGRTAFGQGDFDAAEDAFEAVWKEHPESELASDARFYMAEARYGREKLDGAFELYKQYMRDHPLSVHAPLVQKRLYDIGSRLIDEGRVGYLNIFPYADRGVVVLEYLVGTFPNGDLADDALVYAANYEWETGKYASAIRHLHDLIDFYPTSEWALDARLRLARSYRDANRGSDYDGDALRRSLAQYRAYIEQVSLDPNRAREYESQLALAREELRDVSETLARKGLEAADYYERTGQPEAARAELRIVVRDFPESAAAQEARERLGVGATNSSPEGADALPTAGVEQ